MPQATRVSEPAEFLRLLGTSGILTPDQLAAARQLAVETPDCKMLARRLIAKTLLTRWQASQLLAGWSKLRLGKYKLCQQLGRGPLGRVFLAEHIQLGRQVAIKTLSRRFTQDKEIVERFLAEASRISRLDHRHIMHVFDVDCDNDQYYLIMEYVPGRDLGRLVEQNGPQAYGRIAEIVRQAALGLQHAHELGILHGSVRPANVMLDEQETVKLLDFGFGPLERLLPASSQPQVDPQLAAEVRTYLAPEQQDDSRTVDARADLFALGCTAYWLTTGCPPVPQATATDQPGATPGAPPAIGTLRSDAPAELVQVINRMMAPDADQRFATAEEVIGAVEPWSDRPVEAPDTDTMQPPEFIRPAASEPGPPPEPPSAEAAPPLRPGWQRVLAWPRAWLALTAVVIVGVLAAAGWWKFAADGPSESDTAPARVASPQTSASSRVPLSPPRGSTPPAKRQQKPRVVESTLPQVGAAGDSDAPVGKPKAAAGEKMAAGAATDAVPQKPADGTGGAAKPAADAEQPDAKAKQPPKAKQPDKPAADAPADKPEKPAAEEPPQKPKPPPNPLGSLPPAVGLPLPSDAADDVLLGSLKPSGTLTVALLGGDTAATGSAQFRLMPWLGQGDLAWRVELHGKSQTPVTIAGLRVATGQLRFAWEPAAAEQPRAAHFVNCVLRLQTGPHRHDLLLRQPQHVDPLLVDPRSVTDDLNARLVAPPDPDHVRFQITSLQPPFPEQYTLDPNEPIPVSGKEPSVWITLGGDPSEQVVKIQVVPNLQRLFRLKYTLHFQFDRQSGPQLMTPKNLTYAGNAIKRNQLISNAQAQKIRAELNKLGRQDPQRKQKMNELKIADARLANAAEFSNKLTLLKQWQLDCKDGAPIHFRVFFLAGDCEVELLTTAMPEL